MPKHRSLFSIPIGYCALPALFRPAVHDQAGVDAAEAEGIRQGDVEFMRDGFVGHVVQAALGVGVFEVDCRWDLLIDERQHGDAGFKAARAAEQMAGHGFGGAYRDFLSK